MGKINGLLNYIYICLYLSIILAIPLILLTVILLLFPKAIAWYLIIILYGGAILFPVLASAHQIAFSFLFDKNIDSLNIRIIKTLKENGLFFIKIGLILFSVMVTVCLGLFFYTGTILQFLFIILIAIVGVWFCYTTSMIIEMKDNLKNNVIETFLFIFYKPKFSLFLFLNQVMLFLILQRFNPFLLLFPGLGLFVLINTFYYCLLKKAYKKG